MQIIEHTAGPVPGPGLYRMPAALYHADPCPEPSLSSSVAKLLIENSPAHAHAAHPRLGAVGERSDDSSRPKEIGTAAHKMILGHGAEVVVIDGDDYRKAAAKEARAAAIADGHAPILSADLIKAEKVARAVDARIAAIPECSGFTAAPAELVAIVRDRSGAWLRIMMDRFEVRGQQAIIWDVKSGEQSAAPHLISRRIVNMAMEVQAALYVRVIETLFPRFAGRTAFRWIFVENEVPNAVSVAVADNTTLGIGARKVALALSRWNRARNTDRWPGYPPGLVVPHYPEWAERQWLEREETEPDSALVDWDVSASPFRPLEAAE